jgi:leucyl aminopeptidase
MGASAQVPRVGCAAPAAGVRHLVMHLRKGRKSRLGNRLPWASLPRSTAVLPQEERARPMDVFFRSGNLLQRPAGALVVGLLKGERKPTGVAAAVDRAARGALSGLLARRDFGGAHAEVAVLYPKGLKAKRLLVVGLGPRAGLSLQRVRLAAAAALRKARELRAGTVVTAVLGADRLDPVAAAQATAEGAVLGPWRFTVYRTKPGPPTLKRVEVVEGDPERAAALAAAVERGARWAESAVLARDLTCTPGGDLTPERLAERAKEVARAAGAKL